MSLLTSIRKAVKEAMDARRRDQGRCSVRDCVADDLNIAMLLIVETHAKRARDAGLSEADFIGVLAQVSGECVGVAVEAVFAEDDLSRESAFRWTKDYFADRVLVRSGVKRRVSSAQADA